jgi:hypothetical protein
MALQRLNLGGVGPGQLVWRAFGGVLLRDCHYLVQALRHHHGGLMNRPHLHREHGLQFITWLPKQSIEAGAFPVDAIGVL